MLCFQNILNALLLRHKDPISRPRLFNKKKAWYRGHARTKVPHESKKTVWCSASWLLVYSHLEPPQHGVLCKMRNETVKQN